jgi:Predicted AAA-ATPase
LTTEEKEANLCFNDDFPNHWQTFVVLPKNYKLENGICLNNKTEIIYFKDSHRTEKDFFALFTEILSQKIALDQIYDTETEFGGLFNDPEIHEKKFYEISQHPDEYDCGWWAVYNAIMFVMEGNGCFLNKFNGNKSRKLGYRLRSIFDDDLFFDLTKIGKSSESNNLYPLDLVKNLEKSYENYILNKLEQRKNPEDQDTDIENFNFYYLNVLYCLSENQSLFKSTSLVNKMIKENSELSNINLKPKKNISLNLNSPSFFEMVTENDLFVDKSMFIRKVLEKSVEINSKYIIILRPRRWGKTMNLDMLKTYLEPDIDDNGDFNLSNPNKNYILFEGGFFNSKELTKLKIDIKCRNLKNQYAGKYPVIFINFSIQIEDISILEKVRKNIKNSISRAYKLHDKMYRKCLVNEIEESKDLTEYSIPKIDGMSISKLEKIIAVKKIVISQQLDSYKNYRNGSNDEINLAIELLIDFLNNYYRAKVFVLIDEYDSCINKAINTPYYLKMTQLMREVLLNGLKDNNKVEGVVMTGILPIAKADLFSGMNNFSYYSPFHSQFSDDFGFTDEEVDELLSAYLISEDYKIKQIQKNYVKGWYNGYKIADKTLYNPWSILECLEQAINKPDSPFGPFWVNTGNSNLLFELFKSLESTEKLVSLVSSGKACLSIIKEINNYTKPDELFYSLLFYSGYLTKGANNSYKVPNKEVLSYFYEYIIPIWLEKLIDHEKSLEKIIYSLDENLLNKSTYKQIVENDLLFFLGQSSRSEYDFQALIGGVSMLAKKTKGKWNFDILCECQTNDQKRIDHLFLPNIHQSTVIIHEYKKLDSNSQIEETIEDGFWQIYMNRYLGKPLYFYKYHSYYKHWTSILSRVIVFYKDNYTNTWNMSINEFRHSINQASELNKLFS